MPAIVTQILLTVPLIGAYAMLALGISVIYRASRVLNLAHGAMAMVPAYVSYSMVRAGVPIVPALVVAVLFGAGLGIAIEWVFVRRLRPQGPTAQTVGTVAVAGLLIALAAKIWGTTPRLAPHVFPSGSIDIGASGLRYGDIGLFLTGLVVSLALFTFFKKTEFGLAMRGAAQNRRAAALMGIDPDLAASAAWALGGGLAALAGVMLAAVTNLDPYTLSLQVLPAFVAALIGGLESLPGALGGAVVAGLAFGVVPYFGGTPVIGRVARFNGSPQLALTVLTLVVLAWRGRRLSAADTSEAGLVKSERPAGRRQGGGIRPGWIVAAIALVAWPFVVPFSVLQDSLLAVQLSLAAISIVVLTGWVGQISLAQASFVGIAALSMGLIVRGWGLGFPLSMILAAGIAASAAVLLGAVALRVRGLYLAVATLCFAWMSDAFLFKTPWLGAGTGSSTIPGQGLGDPRGWPYFDLSQPVLLFFVFVAVLGLVVFALANLRDTKTGRAFFAVRGSEMAAASLGIDVVRTKLAAFALAGALAGIAGSLLMINQRTVVPDQFIFTISLQFLAIAVVGGLASLAGAIAAGGLFAALNELFLRVSALSGWLEVVSAGLLAVVLLAYPGGLVAIGQRGGVALRRLATWGRWAATAFRRFMSAPVARPPEEEGSAAVTDDGLEDVPGANAERRRRATARRLIGAAAARARSAARAFGAKLRSFPRRTRPEARAGEDDWFAAAFRADANAAPADGNGSSATGKPPGTLPELAAFRASATAMPEDRSERRPFLEATGITVRFGGLIAVNDASLEVREGEIVGLIGPNGAGKTTLFNAILGLNSPSAGRIKLHGRDATELPPHERARLGVARSFQVIQLFSELSVFDNLLVATHTHNDAGLFSNMAASPRTVAAEQGARRRVAQVLRLLDLSDVAQHDVRGLPFGVLRMVELGRALVTGARLVMLDEPASGLNNAETDRLTEVVSGIRSLGVSVLLIEHDVRMVTGVSDYVYVLDHGGVIAEGSPASIQRDPHVIAAYLGAAAEENAEAAEVVG